MVKIFWEKIKAGGAHPPRHLLPHPARPAVRVLQHVRLRLQFVDELLRHLQAAREGIEFSMLLCSFVE
ncbi:Protein of unknown function [Gryllus bimaculatus]|nr:Protein of unknown function [Gryllus bimaculatus]